MEGLKSPLLFLNRKNRVFPIQEHRFALTIAHKFLSEIWRRTNRFDLRMHTNFTCVKFKVLFMKIHKKLAKCKFLS